MNKKILKKFCLAAFLNWDCVNTFPNISFWSNCSILIRGKHRTSRFTAINLNQPKVLADPAPQTWYANSKSPLVLGTSAHQMRTPNYLIVKLFSAQTFCNSVIHSTTEVKWAYSVLLGDTNFVIFCVAQHSPHKRIFLGTFTKVVNGTLSIFTH